MLQNNMLLLLVVLVLVCMYFGKGPKFMKGLMGGSDIGVTSVSAFADTSLSDIMPFEF